nr:2820_t:CDS:2 [Entrophospora candida]
MNLRTNSPYEAFNDLATVLWIIFCASYLLTFYDDTRRVFRTSQVWARVRNGVGEKMAMLGDGWGDFFQKCFDQWDDVDGNKNGHLGHWEGWLKGTMFNFMTIVTGQGVNDKFKQSAPTFRSQFSNTKNTTTNNNTTRNGDKKILQDVMMGKKSHGFNRFAFFGDSLINFHVTNYIFKKFPYFNNGQLSVCKALLVQSKQLKFFAIEWELDKLANIEGPIKLNLKENIRPYSECLEAYIGGYYLDLCERKGDDEAELKVKELCIDIVEQTIDSMIKTWKV